MSICLISPRFYPVIGGVEKYLQDIAEYCSNFLNIKVVTGDLKNTPKSLFEKLIFMKEKYEVIHNNIEIFRTAAVKNKLLRAFFYINQFINKNLEIFFDKQIMNPNIYSKSQKLIYNQKIQSFIIRQFINQRSLTDPNFRRMYYTLKKLYNDEKFRIIHSSPIYISANIYAYKFSLKNNIAYICTPLYHINPYASYIFYPSYQQILKNSAATIACTHLEKEFYKNLGINKKKIHVIPPGIDPHNYKKANIRQFKNEYNIPENTNILFFMGRKSYEKGAFNTIFALKHLIKRFKDIKLIIAGPSTKSYESFFTKLPKSLKNHIINLGIIDNEIKANALACCDIFLLPSVDDAFGIVFLEAWFFKKPVIGALEGNIAGLIDDNINGFLVPFNNIRKLSLKIEELLRDNVKRENFGQNGYKKLMNNYLLEITNKKILDLYKNFI